MGITDDNFQKLGFSDNESKILAYLLKSGVSNATSVSRDTGVPRNKIYEIMDKLSKTGIVEVQPSRPFLYKLGNIDGVLSGLLAERKALVDEILENARKKQEIDSIGRYPPVWIVRGKGSVRSKLVELIENASSMVFVIGGYPNSYIDLVSDAAKHVQPDKIKFKIISMVSPIEEPPDSRKRKSLTEYRCVREDFVMSGKLDERDLKIISGFRNISGSGCAVVIDETQSFNIIENSEEPRDVIGVQMKIPGVPLIQQNTILRIISVATRRYK